jgi:hypothetical protein
VVRHDWPEKKVVNVLVRTGEVLQENRRSRSKSDTDQISVMAAEVGFDPQPAIQIERTGSPQPLKPGRTLKVAGQVPPMMLVHSAISEELEIPLGIEVKIGVTAKNFNF